MSFHQFQRIQCIHQPVEVVWDFIVNPFNLKKITPKYMGFDIASQNIPSTIYPGMIISYKVAPLLGIKLNWVTEITHVQPQQNFVDEQRMGPYKLWHHQHLLEPCEEGTVMTDIVSYIPPFGVIGHMANKLTIQQQLKEIFDYRAKALQQLLEQ